MSGVRELRAVEAVLAGVPGAVLSARSSTHFLVSVPWEVAARASAVFEQAGGVVTSTTRQDLRSDGPGSVVAMTTRMPPVLVVAAAAQAALSLAPDVWSGAVDEETLYPMLSSMAGYGPFGVDPVMSDPAAELLAVLLADTLTARALERMHHAAAVRHVAKLLAADPGLLRLVRAEAALPSGTRAARAAAELEVPAMPEGSDPGAGAGTGTGAIRGPLLPARSGAPRAVSQAPGRDAR